MVMEKHIGSYSGTEHVFFGNQGSKQAESSSSKSSSNIPINTNEKSTGKIEKVDMVGGCLRPF